MNDAHVEYLVNMALLFTAYIIFLTWVSGE
jgi:hypothetical protein